MIRCVLILLCLILAITCKAQKEIPYNQYKPEDKSVHYYADFNTVNDPEWAEVPPDEGTAHVLNGNFICMVKRGEYFAQDFHPNLDEQRDFEVEFAALIGGENAYNTNGILAWGRPDSSCG